MHKDITVVFFGSFQTYSSLVLEALAREFSVTAVVTTPPKPAGRHMTLTQTRVHEYALKHTLPVFPLPSLDKVPAGMTRPHFLVVAGYGKLIPNLWLTFPTLMPVNMHPSLLPKYRGAFPAEWALLRGEKETGVTLVGMSSEFDKGDILAQTKVPISPLDTRETLYEKLYSQGASLLISTLPRIQDGDITPVSQPPGTYFYAKRITREDGFVAWDEFVPGVQEGREELALKLRALTPWPGVWTKTPKGDRVKLISLTPKPMVQPEGKTPLTFAQFINTHALQEEKS
jgi:methionyl-tRNA formyltransferase